MGLKPAEYSGEELRQRLRQAKATQVSIQSVALWMLERRSALDDMGRDWADLLREEPDPAQQVVYLYVANDALQVGVRKYGRALAQSFAPHLLAAAEFVMRAGAEKVKRCLMKVVGVWTERRVVPLAEIEQLQRVCAGKPAIEPEPEAIGGDGAAGASADDSDAAARKALLREMLSEASIERVLDDLPEVPESAATAGLSGKLQELVSATISADLLSDRMFQLESSLSTFSQAIEAHSAYAGDDADDTDAASAVDSAAMDDADDLTLPRRGAIDWSMLDQQVFDLDVDRSRDHVQQYRSNLEDQSAKREALLEHLRGIQSMDVFGGAELASEETMDAQCRSLERLLAVCFDADALHKQRLEEQRVAYMATQRSAAVFDSSYSSGSAGADRYDSSYYAAGRGVKSPRETDYRLHPGRGNGPPRTSPAPLLRRHSSSSSSVGDRDHDRDHGRDHDRYASRFDREQSPKRAKLVHSHSLEPQNPQWSRDAPSPRFDSDRFDRIDRRGAAASFTAVEEQGRAYGGGGGPPPSRYDHRQYDPPARGGSPPRYPHPRDLGRGREPRGRWDSMPDDLERRRW